MKFRFEQDPDVDFFIKVHERIMMDFHKAVFFSAVGSAIGETFGIITKYGLNNLPPVDSLLPSLTYGVFLSAALAGGAGYFVGSVRELYRLSQISEKTIA